MSSRAPMRSPRGRGSWTLTRLASGTFCWRMGGQDTTSRTGEKTGSRYSRFMLPKLLCPLCPYTLRPHHAKVPWQCCTAAEHPVCELVHAVSMSAAPAQYCGVRKILTSKEYTLPAQLAETPSPQSTGTGEWFCCRAPSAFDMPGTMMLICCAVCRRCCGPQTTSCPTRASNCRPETRPAQIHLAPLSDLHAGAGWTTTTRMCHTWTTQACWMTMGACMVTGAHPELTNGTCHWAASCTAYDIAGTRQAATWPEQGTRSAQGSISAQGSRDALHARGGLPHPPPSDATCAQGEGCNVQVTGPSCDT